MSKKSNFHRQNATTRQQQKPITNRESTGEEAKEEKSEGRAINSNYFPLSNFLTKAMQSNSNSYNGYNNKKAKEGRLIVYPSYTQNIDQTRRRYDMVPSTGMRERIFF